MYTKIIIFLAQTIWFAYIHLWKLYAKNFKMIQIKLKKYGTYSNPLHLVMVSMAYLESIVQPYE